jgi:hypothetical protein
MIEKNEGRKFGLTRLAARRISREIPVISEPVFFPDPTDRSELA